MPKAKKEIKKKGNAKKIILSIAIAIIFVLFIAYAIETIYPSPKYEKYCPVIEKTILNQSDCDLYNGTWNVYPNYVPDKTAPVGVQGYCDTYVKCQKPYESASEKYNRNIFFISLVIGLITIILSFIFVVEAVSSGFMAGGVLLIIYGTIRYWGSLSDILRTIMLGFALAVLIWIGYKKLR